MELVSVIIPTFNRENTILRAIESVINQTHSKLELLIIDDCSCDNTISIVKSINDSRVKYIQLRENRGACVARNVGIKLAKGEYIAFQDSDDVWRPDKLEKQLHLLKYYDADVCFCKFERHNFNRELEMYYPNLSEGIVSYSELINSSIVGTVTIMAKREVFNSHLFDENIPRLQDYDWVIRAGYQNKFCFANEVLVDVFLQQDSITAGGYKSILSTYLIFRDKYHYLAEKYPSFYCGILLNIGYFKTMLGEDSSADYKSLYEETKIKKDYIKYILAKLRLLRLFYKIKGK